MLGFFIGLGAVVLGGLIAFFIIIKRKDDNGYLLDCTTYNILCPSSLSWVVGDTCIAHSSKR